LTYFAFQIISQKTNGKNSQNDWLVFLVLTASAASLLGFRPRYIAAHYTWFGYKNFD